MAIQVSGAGFPRNIRISQKGQKERCSGGGTRTRNPPVNSRMLCQLSYPGSAGTS